MPPKAKKESLVLLINIGMTSPNVEVNPSSLEKAKHIAKQKIEKMIFLKPKAEIAIILMGSSITKNSLNTEYVEEFMDFQVPNWDLIKKCMVLKPTKHCSNWVEALYATVEFMTQNIIGISTKRIILMSDFNEEADIISQFQADVIANKLSAEKIELITIAEKELHEKSLSPLKISEILLKDVHEKINGQHTTFDNALTSLKFYVRIPARPCHYYYFNLELLDKKIPIVSYLKIDQEKFSTWQKATKNQKLEPKTEYLDRQRTSYTKDEIVKGYKYGEIFIPVEKKLEEDMSYKSGIKSYRIYSFTDRNNIDLEYLYKSASHVLLPSSGIDNVIKPFYSLVQAMHETNSVAIVRKVHTNNKTPRMVALFPCINIPDEAWCLIEIELAFAEDRRIMETRPIKSIVKQLSSEQNEAVDNLIDSLMLSDSGDSYEVDGNQYFLPGCVPNPIVQHRWHMLSYRALNPNKPLPPMENYLNEILETPMIKEKSKFHLQKIAQLFQLKDIEPKMKGNETKNNVLINDNINTNESNKVEDIADDENNSYKEESVLSMDTSDIDLDELAANI